MRRREKEREEEEEEKGLLGALFGGRLERLPAEQTLKWRLPQLQSSTPIVGGFKPGQVEPWGRRRREGRMLTIRDLDSFHLTFR